MQGAEPDLTQGALSQIFGGEDVSEPVLQVLGHKLSITDLGKKKWFRLMLGDGKYSSTFVLLSPQLNHLMFKMVVTNFTVIKLKKFVINRMVNQGNRAMIIMDLEVMQKYPCPTNGKPVPIDTDGKVLTPGTLDQNASTGACAGVSTSSQESPADKGVEDLMKVPMVTGYCLNCSMNKWKQPEDKNILRKCEKCQAVSYCGKACQEEHWDKVHNEHCKYLSGQEKAEHSVHDAESCNYCMAEADAGEERMFQTSGTNPTYFCTFAIEDKKKNFYGENPSRPAGLENSPFPVTGLPGDRFDRLINTTLRLELKIGLTDMHFFMNWEKESKRICDVMIYFKRLLYIQRITLPQRDYLRMQTERKTPLGQVIEDFLEKTRDECSEGLQLLKTFRLILLLFQDSENIGLARLLKSPDRYVHRDERALMLKVREGAFLAIADQVLDALEHQLVPYSDLVAIACKGNTERLCTGCAKEIRIEEIVHTTRMARRPSVSISPIDIDTYTCGEPGCPSQLVNQRKYLHWLTATEAIYEKLVDTRCDSCYLNAPLKEVHRSKCLTKNYCSQACRNADDKFHSICCGQGEVDARKVKVGGKEKMIKANERVDRYASAHIPASSDDPELEKGFKKIIEKVKKVKIL